MDKYEELYQIFELDYEKRQLFQKMAKADFTREHVLTPLTTKPIVDDNGKKRLIKREITIVDGFADLGGGLHGSLG